MDPVKAERLRIVEILLDRRAIYVRKAAEANAKWAAFRGVEREREELWFEYEKYRHTADAHDYAIAAIK